MRTRARTDSNHAAIVSALRSAGCLVQSLAATGKGVPDLLVCCPRGKLQLLEVKSGDGKLKPDQIRWHAAWSRIAGIALHVVRNEAEALMAVGIEVREQ
jgi:hypothetical protein